MEVVVVENIYLLVIVTLTSVLQNGEDSLRQQSQVGLLRSQSCSVILMVGFWSFQSSLP